MRILFAAILMFSSHAALAQSEFLPPDFFKGETPGKYIFNPKLEVPCTTRRSGFCPNYGTGADQVPANWVIARYKSRHAGGFDGGTSSLLMVYIPPCSGECPEGAKVNGVAETARVHRWLNFALPPQVYKDTATATPRSPIPDTYESDMPRTFTMVSMTEGEPSNVHFNKFQRGGSGNEYRPDEGSQGLTSCYSCHPNGLRAISPLGYHIDGLESAKMLVEGYNKDTDDLMLDEETWKAVDAINTAMEEAAGDKAVKWDEGFNPFTSYTKILGPKVALDAPTRQEQFIRKCMTARTSYSVTDIFGRAPGKKNVYTMRENPQLDWKKIKSAMNCSSCHNNKKRGAITNGTAQNQILFKILVDQSMPVGALTDPVNGETWANSLDVDHRIALTNCLFEEFETF